MNFPETLHCCFCPSKQLFHFFNQSSSSLPKSFLCHRRLIYLHLRPLAIFPNIFNPLNLLNPLQTSSDLFSSSSENESSHRRTKNPFGPASHRHTIPHLAKQTPTTVAISTKPKCLRSRLTNPDLFPKPEASSTTNPKWRSSTRNSPTIQQSTIVWLRKTAICTRFQHSK